MVNWNLVIDVIQAFSSAVLAIFTVVLAVATWRYYTQSKEQTEEISKQTMEMMNTRKLQHEPQMKAGIRTFHHPNFCISFVNIGGGIAQDVHATYYVKGYSELKREWGMQIHYPEDTYNIGIPLDDSPVGVSGGIQEIESYLDGEDGTFVIEWEYKDAAGNGFEHTQEFSIIEKIEDVTESTGFIVGDERETRY